MKYYRRDGRRFVQIENLYGMYANWDGTYSKEKRGNSYGVVVIHNFKEIVIAHLAVVSNKTWYEAKEGGYKLPSKLQLMAAFELKDKFDQRSGTFWTNEEANRILFAYHFYWSSGAIDYSSKNNTYYVREFTTIKL